MHMTSQSAQERGVPGTEWQKQSEESMWPNTVIQLKRFKYFYYYNYLIMLTVDSLDPQLVVWKHPELQCQVYNEGGAMMLSQQ